MSFNPIKAFKTDLGAEERGRKFEKELGFGEGVYCIIARAGNRAYSQLLSALWKANEETLKRGQGEDASDADRDAGNDLAFKLVGIAMSKTILLGWGGFTGEDDTTPLEYSTQAAEDLLALKDFRAKISAIAESHRSFLVKQEAENAKNSAPTLSGSSIGEASTISS